MSQSRVECGLRIEHGVRTRGLGWAKFEVEKGALKWRT